MNRYREILIEPTVWNTYVVAMMGGTEARWRGCFKRCKIEIADQDHWVSHMQGMQPRAAVTLWSPRTPGNVFVYFPRRPRSKDAQDLGAVAHEMMHVTHKILRTHGLKLCNKTEEAYAYLTEFLVRELWAKLIGWKR